MMTYKYIICIGLNKWPNTIQIYLSLVSPSRKVRILAQCSGNSSTVLVQLSQYRSGGRQVLITFLYILAIISLSSLSYFTLMVEHAHSLYHFDACTEAPALSAAKSLQLILLV